MFRFIVRRLLQLVPTLFGLTLLLFVWLHRLPGGPETSILGERGTPALRARIRHDMGLDQPLWVQYGKFMKRLLSGDLGTSVSTHRPVTTVWTSSELDELARYEPDNLVLVRRRWPFNEADRWGDVEDHAVASRADTYALVRVREMVGLAQRVGL